jgi:hypothetical protein
VIKKKLTSEARRKINAPLEKSEIEKAIDLLRSGTAPGIDGLPIDLYKEFKADVSPILHAALADMVSRKRMNDDMRIAVVTLLYKKKDPCLMKNYRPISLLGSDYKVLAKILAERLKPYLPALIHLDQQGFVEDGDIRGNILLQKYMARYCRTQNTGREDLWETEWSYHDSVDEEKKGGIAVFYDGEKAYDRQDREYMTKVLRRMGLGEFEDKDFFLRAVETLYTNTEAVLKMNGQLTGKIKVRGGVRQGCPLSCYLYILAVEPLAELIRQDEAIKGIPTPSGRTVKVTLFADDLTGYVQDWDSLKSMSECMAVFERASGAKINAEKTFVMVMGTRWGCKGKDKLKDVGLEYDLLEDGKLERYLGELIQSSGLDTDDYQQVLLNAQKVVRGWLRLRVSPASRARVANLLVLPKILFRASVAAVTSDEIATMQRIMTKYV